jgi:hypothetical protein
MDKKPKTPMKDKSLLWALSNGSGKGAVWSQTRKTVPPRGRKIISLQCLGAAAVKHGAVASVMRPIVGI